MEEISFGPVQEMNGLHLFHTDISNCCDKVRIALAEKNLKWEDHFFVLPKGDHLTKEFFSINPKGVVPVLVDKGKVYTESNNIIEYLDRQYPEPPLCPELKSDRISVGLLMESAQNYHPCVAALSFEFLFKAAPYSPEFFQKRAALKTEVEPEMEAIFDRDNGGVVTEKVTEAIVLANKAFKELDSLLSSGDWLVGDRFSLADIAWAVQIHRLKTIRLKDIDNYPNLVRWYKTLEERESVKKGMLEWETPESYAFFNNYLDQREAEETDINSPIWRV